MAVSGGRAVGYRRVSTQEQVDSQLGLDAQLATIRVTAQRLNLELVATLDDAAVSGGTPIEERPGLLAAIDMLASGDVLVCARRDRLGRDLVNVALIERLIERRGARIVSPDAPDDDSPTSILMRQIIDCFSQYERLVIKARTRSALQAKKRRGERAGWLPYGHRLAGDGIHLEPNPDEQQTLATIRALRSKGYALVSIADELNASGIQTRHGRPWQRQAVGQLLERHP